MSEEPIEHGEPKAPSNLATGLIKAIRPRQWVKNVLVLAAPLAAGNITDVSVLGSAGIAFVAFCLAASSIYLVNDAMDVEAPGMQYELLYTLHGHARSVASAVFSPISVTLRSSSSPQSTVTDVQSVTWV